MEKNKIKRMESLGFTKEMENLKNGLCVFCKSTKLSREDFKDELSWKEFQTSGMCQKCQDKLFN